MKKIYATTLGELANEVLVPFCLDDGLEVVLLRRGEVVQAFQRFCPHEGMPLEEFAMVAGNDTLICRAHNFPFSLESGKYKRPAPKCGNLATYPVVVEGEQVFVLATVGQFDKIIG